MKFPCELTVWYVLPAIRSELAKELARLKMSQKDISERLSITQAAVSQYVNGKRGHNIKFKKGVRDEIKKLAGDINDGAGSGVVIRVCSICNMVKDDGTICEIHRRYESIPKKCNACFAS